MLRTVVATVIVMLAACGRSCAPSEDKPEVGTGPAYTPVVANGLRGIAADCKTTKSAPLELLRCTSTKGLVEVTLHGNHFVSLSIALRSMILPEAKSHLSYALKDIVGAGLEQVIAKLEKMETGDRAELPIGGAKVVLVAGGTSRIAPEYKVEISWQ